MAQLRRDSSYLLQGTINLSVRLRLLESGCFQVLNTRMQVFRMLEVLNLAQIQIEKAFRKNKKHIHKFAWRVMESGCSQGWKT